MVRKHLIQIFKIEIQEFLSRVAEVEAESSNVAISIINEKYQKAEIVLDYNDFVEVDFVDINTQSKKDEKNILVREIVDYLFEDEKIKFEKFNNEPENHIYKKLLRLKQLDIYQTFYPNLTTSSI